MKKLCRLFLVCFGAFTFFFSPGPSWGEEKKGTPAESPAPEKGLSQTVKEKAKEELEAVKKDTKEAGREIKESGKQLPAQASKEFKKTGKAIKESGQELNESVQESSKELKKLFKK